MMVYVWLVLVFVLGAVVGSFINVCVARLPLEKSVLWPGSRCGNCFQPVRWYDNLPLISYWWLRGRCRVCKAPFSIQYFLVELLTGVGFAALFYLEVVYVFPDDPGRRVSRQNPLVNLHGWPVLDDWAFRFGVYPWTWCVAWGVHAILFSFLRA